MSKLWAVLKTGGHWLAATALVATVVVIVPASPASAAPRPVTVSITQITQIGTNVDPGPFQGPVGDFYAGVTIGSGPRQNTFSTRYNFPFEVGTGFVFPFTLPPPPPSWTLTQAVDTTAATVPVAIELWDNDDCGTPFCTSTGPFGLGNADDQVDISPTGSETLHLNVNLATGKWSGDVNFPQNCAQGTGGEAVKICFDVNTVSSAADADNDGLLDAWEEHGFNANGDNTIDVNLPAMGADPRRKDLFVEADCLVATDHSHCPMQNAITDVVRSFANAPVKNPDGTSGIQLHVDTGTLFGAGLTTNVAGGAGVAGNVGDFGGGGTQIAEAGNTIIDWDGSKGNPATSFYDLKAKNFNANRAQIFRYVIFGHQVNARAAANDCTSGWAEGVPGNDFIVSLGGLRDTNGDGKGDAPCWGTDAGGKSVGTRVQQAGTFMHELGHTLGLDHGGNDQVNNKPNYLSVMNYSFQPCAVPASPAGAPSGIPGGCDYSRGVVNLNEASLDECVGLGAGLGFGSVDWNGNAKLEGTTNCTPPNNKNVSKDVNGDKSVSALNGFNDWANIFYKFQTLPNFANGIANPVANEPDPQTIEDAQKLLGSLMAPSLQVNISGPSTAAGGEDVSYAIDVVNTGHGPALDTGLDVTLPDQTVQHFDISDLLVGKSTRVHVDVPVAGDACSGTLNVSAKADFQGFTGLTGSANGTFTTIVKDDVSPGISVSLSPQELFPANHQLQTIHAHVTASDKCDAHPLVRLASITSSEPDFGLGHGDKHGDIAGVAFGTDDTVFQLRAERDLFGPGRVYTVVYEAVDSTGNVAHSTATVSVPPKRGRR